jgi:uncharacterized alpha-E superfamily protein
MLSREADACYWIGRSVERAEATARMVDVHYHAALETFIPLALGDSHEEGQDSISEDVSPIQWQAILAISGNLVGYEARYGVKTDRDVLYYFGFDPENSNSILSVWKAARENARSIRDQISSEMWESLNSSFLKLREWNVDRVLSGSPHEYFQTVRDYSHLFQGILNRTLMMGEARDWIDTGRFLERADQTTRLLNVTSYDSLTEEPKWETSEEQQADAVVESEQQDSLGPLNIHAWIAVLKSACAFEMYRKTYRDGIRPVNIVDFLVLNQKFPASVRHSLERVGGCLSRISGSVDASTEPERLLGRLRADLLYMRAPEVLSRGLHECLNDIQNRCVLVGNSVTRTYLSY